MKKSKILITPFDLGLEKESYLMEKTEWRKVVKKALTSKEILFMILFLIVISVIISIITGGFSVLIPIYVALICLSKYSESKIQTYQLNFKKIDLNETLKLRKFPYLFSLLFIGLILCFFYSIKIISTITGEAQFLSFENLMVFFDLLLALHFLIRASHPIFLKLVS